MLRLLRNEPKVEIAKPSPELQIVRVGISLWEPEPTMFVPERPEECAVCGINDFESEDRHSAFLNPRFNNGFQFLQCVWVHLGCFENCIETEEPDPVPW